MRDEGALAWTDISTGEVRVMPCPLPRLLPELARLSPREILVSETREVEMAALLTDIPAAVTPLSRGSFDSASAEKRLRELWDVRSLDAFGTFGRAEMAALGALIDYLDLTQRGRLPLLRPPVREVPGAALQIDAATRRNLEISQALSGGREGSLLAAMDRTVTAPGARLLERRLSAPSCDLGVIHARHEGVRWLVDTPRARDGLRDALRRVPDMDRALQRIAMDRAGPRDMTAIRAGLEQAGRLALDGAPPHLAEAMTALAGHGDLVDLLDRALVAEPPLLARDGGFICEGFDAELDETRALRDEGRGVIARMQADYIAQTGV